MNLQTQSYSWPPSKVATCSIAFADGEGCIPRCNCTPSLYSEPPAHVASTATGVWVISPVQKKGTGYFSFDMPLRCAFSVSSTSRSISVWQQPRTLTSGCLIIPRLSLSTVKAAYKFVSMPRPIPSKTTRSTSFAAAASSGDTCDRTLLLKRVKQTNISVRQRYMVVLQKVQMRYMPAMKRANHHHLLQSMVNFVDSVIQALKKAAAIAAVCMFYASNKWWVPHNSTRQASQQQLVGWGRVESYQPG